MRPEPAEVQRIACVGAGVIGGGWAAHFLARGYEVVAWDPAPDAEARLRELVATAWPALAALGLAADASPDRLTFAATLEEARGRGGIRPGKRAGAPRAETRAAGSDRSGDAARRS